MFSFLKKKEPREPIHKASRSEIISKIASEKRNGGTSIHIDDHISLNLQNELSLMGCDVYETPGFGANIYWKN